MFVTQWAEAYEEALEPEALEPPKTFKELRLEVLELDLSSFGQRLSPYQLWLIHYWRGKYVLLLDVDTFAAAFESWKQRGFEVTVDLSDLFDDTRYIYLRDLVTLIRNADLALHEKDFLELFLIYILNQGEGRFISIYQLNALADRYLSKHPYSPFARFVQRYIQVELPPVLWTFGGSPTMFGVAVPCGNISDYFSAQIAVGFELQVSYRNIVLTPSASWTGGSIKTSFSYDGEDWNNDGFMALMLDLSLGYRVKLFPKFAVTPKGGLGLLNIWEIGEEGGFVSELGFTPTASLGIAFEYFEPFTEQSNVIFAFGVDYKHLMNAWDDRFKGSELVLLFVMSFLKSF